MQVPTKQLAKLILLLAVLFVAACATPNDLRQRRPDLVVDSEHAAKMVAICIADKWEHGAMMQTLPISMRETTIGYSITMLNSNGYLFMLADISALPENRSKTVIHMNTLGTGDFLSRVQSCQ